MVITELSLVEYYDKIIPRAKRKNYKWVISVIARHACIFRKNRALAPHERSAVPLGTDHCPVG